MKKRVLAGIMMAVMMMASVMGVSAAGSKQDEVSASGDSAAAYTVVAGDQSLKASAAQVKEVAGKQIITTTAVYDVKETTAGSAKPNASGKYEVKLAVSGLSSNCSDIVVLCYEAGTQTWNAVKVDSSKVDYKNGTMDVELPNLGPIVIYASVAAGGSTGTSPSTVGTSSAWMLWLAVALLAVGAGVVATQKKSR